MASRMAWNRFAMKTATTWARVDPVDPVKQAGRVGAEARVDLVGRGAGCGWSR